MGHNGAVFENVIVPFDGTQHGRAALGPAADLAWRCGAQIVIVNNSEVSDSASREAVKAKARSMSGADVDFWVDVNHSLGGALLEAAKIRPNSMICLAVTGKPGLRKKFSLTPVAESVFRGVEVPVMVVGPATDVSRGLPMAEIVASLDGSAASERVLTVAAEWARTMKLRLVLVGVVAETSEGPHAGEIDYLRGHIDALHADLPHVSFELLSAADPVSGLVDYMGTRPEAVLCMSSQGRTGGHNLVGNVALGVINRNPRATVVVRV
jgi:nucleotide-binding universal stress UspA family protein